MPSKFQMSIKKDLKKEKKNNDISNKKHFLSPVFVIDDMSLILTLVSL